MYSKSIADFKDLILKARKSVKAFNNEEVMTSLLTDMYNAIYSQIHGYLDVYKSKKNEMEIRRLLREEVHSFLMPIVQTKINRLNGILTKFENSSKQVKERNNYEKNGLYLIEYLDLYKKLYALMAFRSLEHWFQYYEYEYDNDKKLWKYSLDPLNDGGYSGLVKGYCFYATKAILDGGIDFIEMQMPTGTGKSYKDILTIGFLVGLDFDNDCLKVFGNASNVEEAGGYLKDLFLSPLYAEVFPRFKHYHMQDGDLEQNMFEKIKIGIGVTIRFKGSNKTNVRIVSKDKKISGVRAKYIFLDDITQEEDTENMKRHEWDWDRFWNVWYKRRYMECGTVIFASGTTYHYYDILSRLKEYFSGGKLIRSSFNKYTYLNEKGNAVFIVVPALDPETGESTLPQKYSTEDRLAIKERNERMFYAMEQQAPLPPENSPFYMSKLREYEAIPTENRSPYCWASLDTARIGKDYNALAIFTKVGDDFYLKDCLYVKEPMDKVYQQIIDKIKQHNITKLVIEINIDTSLKAILTKMMEEQGIYGVTIDEVYSTLKKEEKIYNMEGTIKERIVFPAQHLYSVFSPMGQFMQDIYTFSYTVKNAHDDSIDAVATFAERYIRNGALTYATVGTFRR